MHRAREPPPPLLRAARCKLIAQAFACARPRSTSSHYTMKHASWPRLEPLKLWDLIFHVLVVNDPPVEALLQRAQRITHGLLLLARTSGCWRERVAGHVLTQRPLTRAKAHLWRLVQRRVGLWSHVPLGSPSF